MRLLVLGGTHHVGRAVVETALADGHTVTTLTRGVSGPSAPGTDERHADRRDGDALATALGGDEWDVVVDTWSQAPAVVLTSATLLRGRAAHYCYVSSRSVYAWPIAHHADESAPVVEGDPASEESSDYAEAKRGGELAALEGFGADVLLARAGLILGPWERVGRLPFWLERLARGGDVPAPGPVDRPLQYVDARDLAAWLVDAGSRGVRGAFNAVSQPGHTTIGELLGEARRVTGGRSKLVWLTPEQVEAAGVAPWTELPIWMPPTGEMAALHDGDVGAASAAGLVCRPVAETVADTWAWLQTEGNPGAGRPGTGFDDAAEERMLALAGSRPARPA
ncbi:MAG: NAD-dependent epimerase/dehydratase family protein [Nocardioidaceae bacterium]